MGTDFLSTDLCFNITVVVSVILVIVLLPKFTDFLPVALKCLFKWKENLALEFSVKLSRDRNVCYAALILPLCLMLDRHWAFPSSILANLGPAFHLASTFFIVFAFIWLRNLINRIFKSRSTDSFSFLASFYLFRTFFCIAVPVCLATLGVLILFHVSEKIVDLTVFYEIIFFYALFLWRKREILRRHCSILQTIFYLCVLEILPAGFLVILCLI